MKFRCYHRYKAPDWTEVEQMLLPLDALDIYYAVVLLQLSREFGYSIEEVAQALSSKKNKAELNSAYYAAYRDKLNSRRKELLRLSRRKQKEI